MITSEEIEKALTWMRDSADEAAEARANRLQLEEFTKHLKADLMFKYTHIDPDSPVNAQERYALSHPDYKTHLQGLREAIRKDEWFRWLKDTAMAKIEVYRTYEATRRSLDR